MTENRRQVLEMLASGRITAEEADRLLGALDASEAPAPSAGQAAPRPTPPKYLRVIVDANDNEDGPVHINVRVPIMLLRAGVRLASLIPGPAQVRVNEALREQGIPFDVSQIKPENINEIIDQLSDFSVDIDQQAEDVKIKVFAE
jgi:SHOCT-like domain